MVVDRWDVIWRMGRGPCVSSRLASFSGVTAAAAANASGELVLSGGLLVLVGFTGGAGSELLRDFSDVGNEGSCCCGSDLARLVEEEELDELLEKDAALLLV